MARAFPTIRSPLVPWTVTLLPMPRQRAQEAAKPTKANISGFVGANSHTLCCVAPPSLVLSHAPVLPVSTYKIAPKSGGQQCEFDFLLIHQQSASTGQLLANLLAMPCPRPIVVIPAAAVSNPTRPARVQHRRVTTLLQRMRICWLALLLPCLSMGLSPDEPVLYNAKKKLKEQANPKNIDRIRLPNFYRKSFRKCFEITVRRPLNFPLFIVTLFRLASAAQREE